MDKFKNSIRRDIALFAVYSALFLSVVLFGIWYMGQAGEDGSLIPSFCLGMSAGIELLMLYFTVKNMIALRDEKKLKKLYIAETDERNQFIQAKISGLTLNLVFAGLLLGTMAAGFLNETVFYTLLAALLCTVFIKLVLKLIYHKKY